MNESSHRIREKIISARVREAVADKAGDVDLQTVVSKGCGAVRGLRGSNLVRFCRTMFINSVKPLR
jgi:hypothetical protein